MVQSTTRDAKMAMLLIAAGCDHLGVRGEGKCSVQMLKEAVSEEEAERGVVYQSYRNP